MSKNLSPEPGMMTLMTEKEEAYKTLCKDTETGDNDNATLLNNSGHSEKHATCCLVQMISIFPVLQIVWHYSVDNWNILNVCQGKGVY